MSTKKGRKKAREAVGLHELARRSGLTYADLTNLVEVMSAALDAGERVQLTSFGSFRGHKLAPRTFDRRSIANIVGTPDVIVKPERLTVLFSPSPVLRERLNDAGDASGDSLERSA